MKKINIILIFSLLLVSCGNAGKILRNEKIRTTDEFLVKKKGPLVLPPDYEKIPEPGSVSKKELSEEDKLKKIIKASKGSKTKNKSSSVENSILKNIRK
jgi:uncharacterized protein YcfL|tara:strand:+ start:353 stop:649 length:297 start_codon:yes stop_codon:yes gene_type:complete